MSLSMSFDPGRGFPKLDWEAAAGLWSERAGLMGHQLLRANAPFFTGRLRESIDDETKVEPGLATIVFYSQVDYAKYVLDGTRAHTITPRNARALRWMGRGGIGTHFARRVQHPGTTANDFPVKALGAVGPALAVMFAKAVEETMEL